MGNGLKIYGNYREYMENIGNTWKIRYSAKFKKKQEEFILIKLKLYLKNKHLKCSKLRILPLGNFYIPSRLFYGLLGKFNILHHRIE